MNLGRKLSVTKYSSQLYKVCFEKLVYSEIINISSKLQFSSSPFNTRSFNKKWVSLSRYKGINYDILLVNRNKEFVEMSNIHPPDAVKILVYGTGKSGTPNGVFISTENSSNWYSYLFNCGEGTQRTIAERKIHMLKTNAIFFTRQGWKNVGGFLGYCLSLDKSDIEFLPTYGPKDCNAVEFLSQGFARLVSLENVHRNVVKETISDGTMTIDIIPIDRTESAESSIIENELTPSQDSRCIMYVCKPHPARRKVDVALCDKYRVPRNKVIKELVSGNSITLEDGTVVHPDDVLERSKPNRNFIVLQCADTSYIDSLIKTDKQSLFPGPFKSEAHSKNSHDSSVISERTKLKTGQSSTENNKQNKEDEPVSVVDKNGKTQDKKVQKQTMTLDVHSVIMHITPTEVFEDPRYQKWIDSLGDHVHHFVLNEDGSDIIHQRLYEHQSALNLLHPSIFPLLPAQIKYDREIRSSLTPRNNVTQAQPGMEIVLRSVNPKPYITCHPYEVDVEKHVQLAMKNADCKIKNELEQLKSNMEQIKDNAIISKLEYPEFVFCGTASAKPEKIRNVTGILVHLREDTCLLLDCGEGTVAQLYRQYGDNTKHVLCKIKAVFISHLHTDHHMGLIALISERKRTFDKLGIPYTKLIVIGPGAFVNWIMKTHRLCYPSLEYIIYHPVENLDFSSVRKVDSIVNEVKDELQIKEIEACSVNHPQIAHGLQVTCDNGYKFVYSGDTTDNVDNLVEIGMNCDLLIHEATFSDVLKLDAYEKRHSTISQALGVGKKMNAAFTLLTHFSQRYPHMPELGSIKIENFGVAHDFMKVRPCDLHLLPLFIPALQSLFMKPLKSVVKRDLEKKQKSEHKNNAISLLLSSEDDDDDDDEDIPMKKFKSNLGQVK